MRHPAAAAAALLAAAFLAGCYTPPPPTPAQTALRTDCRDTANREYIAQNRDVLTQRDERDTAYSAGYEEGVPSRGLGAEYAREREFDACLHRGGAPVSQDAQPGVGPAFSPNTPPPGSPSP